MGIYSKLDELREEAMFLIENHIDELDADHLETFKGLLETEKLLDRNSETFADDVRYYLNICIEILTTLEVEILTEKEKIEFEDICINAMAIYHFDSLILNQGDLIIYENAPYQICEIDYDDLTVCLSSGEDYFYVDFNDIK